ncbi:MAG TPA: glycine cleavage system aminomethyltransferase GcvT [Dehalococcoidia bacterium]|nr:glycine cleavage system aminomethyltransferase GcvT [Dehalococcoidia bacterium]
MKPDRASPTPTLRRTALYPEHQRLGARMVPFAGWEMPVQYAGIVQEHQAVRQNAGMFDVSHMGRFEVQGEEAARLLRHISTYDITRLAPGDGHYSVVCQPDGGILDDIYIFRLPSSGGYLVVANAANAERVFRWTEEHSHGFQARLVNRHESTSMIAVQGPQAVARCAEAVTPQLADIEKRRCLELDWQGEKLFASRTGYTGEDGLELVLPGDLAPELWQRLLAAGVEPCGLGARDTLRLEAALLLYGNDIDTTVNPFEAGLDWVVSTDDGADFIGREALLEIRERGPARLLACLKAESRDGIMRHGYPVLHQGKEVSRVSSGGFSPTLGISIGMALLPARLAAEGTSLIVDVRGRHLPVRVVRRPFYRPAKRS